MVVKIRVSCYNKADRHFYSEYEYHNEDRGRDLVNIYLDYRYYMSLESARQNIKILLNNADLFKMQMLLNHATLIFGKNPWTEVDGILRLNFDTEELEYEEKFWRAYMTVVPSVMKYRDGEYEGGITLSFYDELKAYIGQTFLNYDQTLGANDFFRRCDPAVLAQLLVNYMQIPKPGTNRKSIVPQETATRSPAGIVGRQIGNKRGGLDSL